MRLRVSIPSSKATCQQLVDTYRFASTHRPTMNFSTASSLILALFCAFAAPIDALKIGKGLIRIDDQNFDIFNEQVPLNLTDTRLSVGFTLIDENEPEKFLQPEQVMISLSVMNVVSEFYLHPNFIHDKVFEANIAVSELSKFLLVEEKIDITVITGDSKDKTYNKILKVGSITPSEKLRKDKKVDFPKRLQQYPEIKHIFRGPPKNLPAFISMQFVFLLVIAFVVLILSWNYFEAININNLNKFGVSTFIFIASIFAFEYTFFDYYIATSVFTTIYRVALISLVSVYFGSKCLKNMYKLRNQNLR